MHSSTTRRRTAIHLQTARAGLSTRSDEQEKEYSTERIKVLHLDTLSVRNVLRIPLKYRMKRILANEHHISFDLKRVAEALRGELVYLVADEFLIWLEMSNVSRRDTAGIGFNILLMIRESSASSEIHRG